MNEWGAFKHAIVANDAAKVIAIATPDFVGRYPHCLLQFCGIRVDFTEDETVIKHLYAMGASSDDEIHYAIASSRPQLTKILLKFGYCVNRRNYFNFTPLDIACREANKIIQAILIDAGGELWLHKHSEIQEIIDFRKNARIASITCIGIGRKRREGRDVFAIIARAVWALRMSGK